MTTASHSWKQALQRKASVLREILTGHRVTETTRVKMEEAVVVGCYAIRHLLNGFVLSESCRHQVFPMTVFPRRLQSVPLLGDEPLALRYDLDRGRTVQHDLLFLCHQVLQNCVFDPWFSAEHRLTGIYVTSDHQRKVALYGIGLTALADLFARLGADPTRAA